MRQKIGLDFRRKTRARKKRDTLFSISNKSIVVKVSVFSIVVVTNVVAKRRERERDDFC